MALESTTGLRCLELVCAGLVALSIGSLAYALSTVPVRPSPRLGRRGAERLKALSENPLFAAFEPALRFVAGFVAGVPLPELRVRQELDLMRAGYPLGLTADEFSALSILSGLGLGVTVGGLLRAVDQPLVGAVVAAAVGFLLPTLQVRERSKNRSKSITRSLPNAIELAAMCMSAGLDFPGAIRQLSERGGSREATPLATEFSSLLEELELGHTRREALKSLARRIPTPAVRDFVNAVVQADEKGSPLAQVLRVQGRMLSMRRSVAAEEAAARAGVLMIVPMMLLVGCILLLLMGPFIVKGIGF